MSRLLRPPLVAVVLWVVCLLLAVYTTVLRMLVESSAGEIVFAALSLTLPTCGAIVAARRPTNPVGWLLLAAALALTGPFLSESYNDYIYEARLGPLPLERFALWLGWLGPSGFTLLVLSLLFFPTGSPPSARWRTVFWGGAAMLIAGSLGKALRPGPLPGMDVENPFGIDGLEEQLEVLSGLFDFLFVPFVLAVVASLIVRFHNGSAIERLQIKWTVYAVVLGLLAAILGEILRLFDSSLWRVSDAAGGMFTWVALPAALAVSILRYRLYDIDRLFSRTLVYGVLTAGLALVYFGLVVGLQALLAPVNGGSDLAIALTTLVVAGLFLPARRRVQNAVDRRFNRRAYDAQHTIDAFSTRLRDQVELHTLRQEVLDVVNETMQPQKTSLWLREVVR